MNDHAKAWVATAGSAVSLSSFVADANAWLQLAVGFATLAWWMRLWLKNPKIKPPKNPNQ
jgi:hypothetical protein